MRILLVAASVCVMVGALMPGDLVAQAGAPPITVGANIQISGAFTERPHAEVVAAADPGDAGRLVACSMVEYEDRSLWAQHCYSSFDSGASWEPTLVLDDATVAGDPAAAYGAGDIAIVVALINPLAVPRFSEEYATHVFRSSDGGRTWAETAKFLFIDREYVVIDRTGGDYNGQIYINGQRSVRGMRDERPPGIYLFRSRDGGDNFMGPTVRLNLEGGGAAGVTNMVVLSDGRVGMLFGHTKSGRTQDLTVNNGDRSANATIEYIFSKDGGETLEPAVVVSDFFMDRPRSEGANLGQLAVDATDGPFKDRLYAVWPGVRDNRLQVMFSYSADKGETWTRPLLVNDDRSFADQEKKRDHILPAVAVNKDGVVAVSWYDRRDSPDNMGWTVRLAASFDGGETFTASVPVSSEPNVYDDTIRWPAFAVARHDEESGVLALNVGLGLFFESGGHTTGLVASADGMFHPVWVDNRTGVGQLWTAPVTVTGQAVRNGAAELADLEDITAKVAFEMTDIVFDRATNTVRVTARLKNNTEDHTLAGPLMVRVIRLDSRLGVPEILDTDNGRTGVGAAWDLTSLLPEGGLAPEAMSESRVLRFHLSDLQPLGSGRDYTGQLVQLEARVLGKATQVEEDEG